MTVRFNKYPERDKRKALRNNATPAEDLLWQHLRKRRMEGFKFRRQYGVDAFVVDFYCPRLKLAIEIDGGVHNIPQVKISDRERQEYIEQFNIIFLRLSNDSVLNHIDDALDTIRTKIKEITSGE